MESRRSSRKRWIRLRLFGKDLFEYIDCKSAEATNHQEEHKSSTQYADRVYFYFENEGASRRNRGLTRWQRVMLVAIIWMAVPRVCESLLYVFGIVSCEKYDDIVGFVIDIVTALLV